MVKGRAKTQMQPQAQGRGKGQARKRLRKEAIVVNDSGARSQPRQNQQLSSPEGDEVQSNGVGNSGSGLVK